MLADYFDTLPGKHSDREQTPGCPTPHLEPWEEIQEHMETDGSEELWSVKATMLERNQGQGTQSLKVGEQKTDARIGCLVKGA